MPKATFRAIIRQDGRMVAGIAAIVDGKVRFFVAQRRETQEAFVGRVSLWVKSQQGEALEMAPPEVLPEGVEDGEVVMRLKQKLGIPKESGDASEYDVRNAQLVHTVDGGARLN